MPLWTKEQTEAIMSEGENIIVSASAGSGKTAVLSERVLRKLKGGVNINELLILTFTKAAASEMKERIRKKILADKSLSSQLERIDSAYITTFDSFALSIVKKYNYVLNVIKDIKIIESSLIEIIKRKYLDEIFDNFYQEKNPLFLKLIGDFCVKDDNEIVDCILKISSKLDLIYKKEEYLDNYISSFYNDNFINEKILEYEELLNKKIAKIYELVNMLNDYVDNDYYEKINNALGELFISNTYEQIKSNLKSIPNLPKNSEEEAKKIKEQIAINLKELANLCSYESKEELKNSIYKTKDYGEIIVLIIKALDKKIAEYKKINDLYEFNDVAKMAINILENNPDIRKELKESLKEILIDEYQDTNDLQELLISYISNNNVYMVGDIKQSIYRFRNANPNLFKNKYNDYSNFIGGKKIDLNKNFRSREEVLNNINLIFNLVMNDEVGGANYQKSHQMIFGNSLYKEEGLINQDNNLEILNYFYDKKGEFKKEEIEAFIIANDIKNKIKNGYKIFDKDEKVIRNLKYEDIVILMDRATNFELYKKIFEFLNIPLSIYKDEDIKNNGDINLIKNILTLLLNKDKDEYKYAFISLARSYLFNLDDNLIFSYVMENNYQNNEIYNISKDIDFNNLNLKELLIEIIEKFNFYEKIITVGDIENHLAVLDYLVNLAETLNNVGYTVDEFLEYLTLLITNDYSISYNASKNEDGVKIMTIHKSKGLEYHLCYYSGLYAKFNIKDLNEKFLYDNSLGIITPFLNEGIRTTFYKDILKNQYLKEEISEKIRLFYVAVTRAKEKIIMVAPFNILENTESNDNYTSFLEILNSIKKYISLYIKNIDLNSLEITKDYNLIKKSNYKNNIIESNEFISITPYEFNEEILKNDHYSKKVNYLINKNEYENQILGTRIHKILANIDFTNPQLDSLNLFEKQKVLSLLKTDLFKKVINIYKEYEFIYEDNKTNYHGFIDLLLEYENEFKIVDYKLKNIQDEAYVNQLRGYKNYIMSMSNKIVKVYLYSIIDEKLVELNI